MNIKERNKFIAHMIKWAVASKFMGLSSRAIRPGHISVKHFPFFDRLFYEWMPDWWTMYKRNLTRTDKNV